MACVGRSQTWFPIRQVEGKAASAKEPSFSLLSGKGSGFQVPQPTSPSPGRCPSGQGEPAEPQGLDGPQPRPLLTLRAFAAGGPTPTQLGLVCSLLAWPHRPLPGTRSELDSHLPPAGSPICGLPRVRPPLPAQVTVLRCGCCLPRPPRGPHSGSHSPAQLWTHGTQVEPLH